MVAVAPKTPSAPVRKRWPSAARPQAAGASTFAAVLKVEVAKATAAGLVPVAVPAGPEQSVQGVHAQPGIVKASGTGTAVAGDPSARGELEKAREALHAQNAEIDCFAHAAGAMTDPAVLSLAVAKKLAREGLVAQARALKPLALQCRLAADARDKAARRQLQLLTELKALETLAVAKRAGVAQREAHLAQVECDRLTALRQAEIRKEADAVLLQSGLPVPDPGAAVQALAPGLPMQAASSLLQALPPQLAESFKGWWASLSVDQQAVAQPAQGAVHTRPPDARAGLGMDDSSEFEEEEETLALQGVAAVELAPNGETDAAFCPFRRARRPRSDPYPQLGQSLAEAAGFCGLGDPGGSLGRTPCSGGRSGGAASQTLS